MNSYKNIIMQSAGKEKKKIVIKKTNKLLQKSRKKKNYELGKHGPFKPHKRTKSSTKKANKIKIMK